MDTQAWLGARACPTRACRRRETASARASLRLFPAPDAWRFGGTIKPVPICVRLSVMTMGLRLVSSPQ
jgi:hypothetical protein